MTNNSLKKRGTFLTIMYFYGVLLTIMLFCSGIIYPIMSSMDSTAGKLTLLVSIVEFIPLIAALYGIFKWKKWGIYTLITYIAIAIISTYISDIVFKIYTGYAQYVISFDMITAALWFWALSRKWAHFT